MPGIGGRKGAAPGEDQLVVIFHVRSRASRSWQMTFRPVLDKDDVGVFSQAAGASGRRCPARHASDDDQLYAPLVIKAP